MSHIITLQRESEVSNMLISSGIIMLPVLTHGTVSAFLTIALPKLIKENATGIVIDIYQVSWLGECYTGSGLTPLLNYF